MSQDLIQRVLVNGLSTVLIAFLIFFAEYSCPMKWVFTFAIAAIAGVAVWEYFHILKHKQLAPAIVLGIIFTVLYILAVFAKTQAPYTSSFLEKLFRDLPSILLVLSFFACFIAYAISFRNPIVHIAVTLLGILYIAVPLAFIVKIIYFFPDGPLYEGSLWVVYLIAVTKAADMGGYFIGKTFGKNKLASKLSPNKTLEGFFGGIFFSIFLSLLVCFLGKAYGAVFAHFTYLQAVILGIIIGIWGQIGDLAESLLKRDAKVKDSNSIPGVGGVLDMVDSVLFTAPVVYIFLRIFYS